MDSNEQMMGMPNYGKEALIEAQAEGRPLVAAAPANQGVGTKDAANARQVGGEHYKKNEYQHWDYVCDVRMNYLLGCATKYVARWRDKNGKEDLAKAVHYLEKAIERNIMPPYGHRDFTTTFIRQIHPNDGSVVVTIVNGHYDAAIKSIMWLMDSDEA